MGYYIKIVKSDCVIPNESKPQVLQIWKDLNKPENNHLKDGGSWRNGIRDGWHYAWMDEDYDKKCNCVEQILNQLGFDYICQENGNINITSYDSKMGQEQIFFDAVEDLLKGKIVWLGEDQLTYMWEFPKRRTAQRLDD